MRGQKAFSYGSNALLLCGALLSVCALGANSHAGQPLVAPSQTILLAQSGGPENPGTKAEIQNIQRLLTLLAKRYPQKYGKVNPGRLDGTYGWETEDAIRKFKSISGLGQGPRGNDQLVADILAALAQMSAVQGPGGSPAKAKTPRKQVAKARPPAAPSSEAAPTPLKPEPTTTPPPQKAPVSTPKVQAPAPADAPESRPAAPKAKPAPVAEAPKQAAPKEKPSVDPAPAVVPPAAVPKVKAPPPAPAKPLAPAKPKTKQTAAASGPASSATKPSAAIPAQALPKSGRVYFVQVGSLRSLVAAKREWKRIHDENRAALQTEAVYFEKASVAGRGVFFRILIGPMGDRTPAKTLCSYLKQNDQKCVVIGRNAKDLPAAVLQNTAKKKSGRLPQAPLEPEPGKAGKAKAEAPKEPSEHSPPAIAAKDAAPPAKQGDARTTSASPKSDAASASPTAPSAPVRREPAPRTDTGKELGTDGKTTGTATEAPPKPARSDLPAVAAAPLGKVERQTLAAESPAVPAPPAPSPPETSQGQAQPDTTTAAAPNPTREAETAAPAQPATANKLAGSPATKQTARVEAPASAPARSAGTPENAGSSAGSPRIEKPSGWTELSLPGLTIQVDETNLAIGAVALVLVIGVGAGLYGRRRRNRDSALMRVIDTADYPSLPLPANTDNAGETLSALNDNFQSQQLQQSRQIRDEFLRSVLNGGTVAAAGDDDFAIRINSGLKTLLATQPAKYKSIFLNWMFLSEVGAALDRKEISPEQLDDRISREFELLQTYFKIHLLELDARHKLRNELPGLFYGLQLARFKPDGAANFSAA